MQRLRPILAAIAALLSTGVAACHIVPQGGMAERCAAIMRAAYPDADIDITKSEAAATNLTTILAHVEGTRTNVPTGAAVARHLAVECKFEHSVLTGFRWTSGPN